MGRSSQIVNFWPYLLILSLAAVLIYLVVSTGLVWLSLLGLPLVGYAVWLWLGTRLQVFEFTTERIRIYEGILNQEINEVELYRVKDTSLQKPIWLRVFGLSNIVLQTSDRSCPEIMVKAVRDGGGIREKLRKQVELLRDRKRVREVDFEGGEDGTFDEEVL